MNNEIFQLLLFLRDPSICLTTKLEKYCHYHISFKVLKQSSPPPNSCRLLWWSFPSRNLLPLSAQVTSIQSTEILLIDCVESEPSKLAPVEKYFHQALQIFLSYMKFPLHLSATMTILIHSGF